LNYSKTHSQSGFFFAIKFTFLTFGFIMQDLIQQLKTNAGLTDEQALKAIETMKDYIMGNVPPMFCGFVDKFFQKNNPASIEDDPLG